MSAPTHVLKPPEPVSTWLLRAAFGLATLMATLMTALVLFEFGYADRVLPGVRVWGVDLSGLTLPAAERAVAQRFAYLSDPILTVRAPGRTWTVAPAMLGVQVDAAATARAAFRLGRGGSPLRALSAQFDMMMSGADLAPVVVLDSSAASAYVAGRAAELDLEPRNAGVSLDGLTVVVTPAHNGRAIDVQTTLPSLLEAARTLQTATVDIVLVDRPAAITDVTAVAQQLQTLISQPFTLFLENPRPTDSATAWDMTLEQLASLSRVKPSADGRTLIVTLDR